MSCGPSRSWRPWLQAPKESGAGTRAAPVRCVSGRGSFLHDTVAIWAPLYPLLSFELILKAGRVIRLGGRDRVDLARSALRGFHDGVQ